MGITQFPRRREEKFDEFKNQKSLIELFKELNEMFEQKRNVQTKRLEDFY